MPRRILRSASFSETGMYTLMLLIVIASRIPPTLFLDRPSVRPTHSFTRCTHSLTQAFTLSTDALTHALTHYPVTVHVLTHSLTYPLTHSLSHSFMQVYASIRDLTCQ